MNYQIITNAEEALANIDRYDDAIKNGLEVGELASYVRAWYAKKDEYGNWIFGPSKFIGYSNLSASEYRSTAGNLDGRITEKQLQNWFSEVDCNNSKYNELTNALKLTLAKLGKTPSKIHRINIFNEHNANSKTTMENSNDDLIKLLIKVIKRLDTIDRNRIKKEI